MPLPLLQKSRPALGDFLLYISKNPAITKQLFKNIRLCFPPFPDQSVIRIVINIVILQCRPTPFAVYLLQINCVIANPPTYLKNSFIATNCDISNLPKSERIGVRIICLPIHPAMTNKENKYISQQFINTVYSLQNGD